METECCKKCCHCKCNEDEKYTWNHLLFITDIMIQKGILTESQIKKIARNYCVQQYFKDEKFENIVKNIKPEHFS